MNTSLVVLIVFASLFGVYNAQIICGQVQVCVQPPLNDKRKISLVITSLDPVVNIEDGVDASGYFYNLESDVNDVLGSSSATLSADGMTYTDGWEAEIGSGDVQVGFPFIRTYYSATVVCYANLQEIFDEDGSEPCRRADLIRQTKTDFALVVDTTGSMRNDIAQVKADTKDIIEALSDSSTSFRAAIVEYNDRVAPLPDAKILLDFSDDVEEVTRVIDGLHTRDIGGDWKECLYDGLLEADFLDWDDTARRVTVTMGDAPGKVCDSGTTLSDIVFFSEIVTIDITPSVPMLSRASSPAVRASTKKLSIKLPVKKLKPISMVGTRGKKPAGFSEIANKTGGFSVTATTATDTVSKIIAVVKGEDPTTTKIDALYVALDCSISTTSEHTFVITNPNDVTVTAEIRELYTRTKLEVDANPGRNEVSIAKKSRVGLTLSWDDENDKRKFNRLRKSGC